MCFPFIDGTYGRGPGFGSAYGDTVGGVGVGEDGNVEVGLEHDFVEIA